jgi:quinol monooxygenase YgiN
MALGMIFDLPGVTQAQYEQVRNEVSPENRLPPGMLSHVGGASENGWCVVEVWESQDAATHFFKDKLQQALQRAGIKGQPRSFEVANTMQP